MPLRVLEGIRGGDLPALCKLKLYNGGLDGEHGRVLGEAIGMGRMPNLEELEISVNDGLGDDGVVPMVHDLSVFSSSISVAIEVLSR